MNMNEEPEGLGVPTKCTERDVLMGRGKRVSEWPGNIFFRQVINKHREDYNKAIRNQKVDIAHLVIKEIMAIGGRFLREVNPSNDDAAESVWVEVEFARSIEKTCQALREKEKANTTESSPFVGDEVAEKLLEKHRIRDEQKRQKQVQQKSSNNSASSSKKGSSPKRKFDSKKGQLMKKGRVDYSGSSSSSSDDSSTSSSSSSEDSETPGLVKDAKKPSTVERRKKQLEAKQLASGKKLKFPPAEMLERLRSFQEAHGHTAVPPNWPQDVVLADWCTAQRQLYREVESGYRLENTGKAHDENEAADTDKNTNDGNAFQADIISKQQQEMMDTLRSMNFCWDYDIWHWNHRYEELLADSSIGATEMRLWLRDQHRQYREGALSAYRLKKLDDAGVSFL